MPSVTIEQNLESRQTYFRLPGIGHLLSKPQYSIAGDSNEMLGPQGWKNQVIVNEARQCLDGQDLLLEIDSRLINYIETGRAIEVQVDELKFAERIQPSPLLSFPSSKAPLPPGVTFFEFKDRPQSAALSSPPPPAPPPPSPPSPPPQPFVPDLSDLTRKMSGEDLSPDAKAEASPSKTEESGKDKLAKEPADVHARETDGEKLEDKPDILPPPLPASDAKPDEAKPATVAQRNWAMLAAAICVGLILGFFGKYITDEYSPWPNPAAPGAANRKVALIQTDAFGPLSEDLRQLPDKSPAGLAPDAVPGITPLTINRGLSYFNYGAQKARENNRAEAIYWYKRSVKTIEPDALTFLGDGYLNGDGVPRDARTGFQLLRLAAGLGSEKARSYLVDRLEAGSIPNAPTTMGQAFRPR